MRKMKKVRKAGSRKRQDDKEYTQENGYNFD
jgi:hypothetical protein